MDFDSFVGVTAGELIDSLAKAATNDNQVTAAEVTVTQKGIVQVVGSNMDKPALEEALRVEICRGCSTCSVSPAKALSKRRRLEDVVLGTNTIYDYSRQLEGAADLQPAALNVSWIAWRVGTSASNITISMEVDEVTADIAQIGLTKPPANDEEQLAMAASLITLATIALGLNTTTLVLVDIPRTLGPPMPPPSLPPQPPSPLTPLLPSAPPLPPSVPPLPLIPPEVDNLLPGSGSGLDTNALIGICVGGGIAGLTVVFLVVRLIMRQRKLPLPKPGTKSPAAGAADFEGVRTRVEHPHGDGYTSLEIDAVRIDSVQDAAGPGPSAQPVPPLVQPAPSDLAELETQEGRSPQLQATTADLVGRVPQEGRSPKLISTYLDDVGGLPVPPPAAPNVELREPGAALPQPPPTTPQVMAQVSNPGDSGRRRIPVEPAPTTPALTTPALTEYDTPTTPGAAVSLQGIFANIDEGSPEIAKGAVGSVEDDEAALYMENYHSTPHEADYMDNYQPSPGSTSAPVQDAEGAGHTEPRAWPAAAAAEELAAASSAGAVAALLDNAEEPTGTGDPLSDAEAFGTRAVVSVPEGSVPGEAFRVILANGHEVVINCPEGAAPGDLLEIDIPDVDAGGVERGEDDGGFETAEVAVPDECLPGDSFTVQASWGGLFEVVVPRGTVPGSTLFIELPARPDSPSRANPPPSSEGESSSSRVRLQLNV